MKIIIHGEVMRIHRQHSASRLFLFYTGKYRWHGSTGTYASHEVQDIPCILVIPAERQEDDFDSYARLMNVTLNRVWKDTQKSRIIITAGSFLTNFP